MMITNYSTTNGYITIKLGEGAKIAHFGMGFIKLLKDMDYSLDDIGNEMNSKDHITRLMALSRLLFCGFKSYDLELGIEVDYTVELALEWATLLDDKQEKEFIEALTFATSLNEGLKNVGKQKQVSKVLQKKT